MTLPWAPADCETHEYRSASGETLRFRTLKGTVGRMMPPVVNTTLPAPGRAGSRYVGSLHAERIVTLPVVIPGSVDGRPDFRSWGRILDPVKGPGTLTVVQGDWPGRQLICVYDSGLEQMSETDRLRVGGALIFRAAYPYWVDETETETVIGTREADVFWFPFAGSFAEYPLILGASATFEQFTVTNEGDVDAWPIVSVLGPATDVTVRNNTTGVAWAITGEIPAGSTLTVDTRPGQKLVRIDGVNAYDRLTDTSNLWPLVRGVNSVTMSAVAIGDDTIIRFAWRNAWLAA